MSRKSIPGVNIQHPISQLILDGTKTIETRTYPIPQKYVGTPIALIETPGPKGKFKARITAIIQFGPSFRYSSAKEFYSDSDRHKVTPKSDWKWNSEKPKYGWPVMVLKRFAKPKNAPAKRGIVFSSACEV